MQPVKLTINAFLSLEGREEIDFSNIKEEALKRINEDTQQGRAFLLDCICYGLFGSFPSANREINELRCPSAQATDEAFVELEFSKNGRNYRIYRKPAQVREKKRIKDENDRFMKVSAKTALEFLSEDRIPLKRKADVEKELLQNILKQDLAGFMATAQKEFLWLTDAKAAELAEKERKRREYARKQLRDRLPEITRGKKLAGLCYSIINNNLKVIDSNVDICYKDYCLKLSQSQRAEKKFNALKKQIEEAGIAITPKKKENPNFWESVVELGRLFSADDEKSKAQDGQEEEKKLTEEEIKELQQQLLEAGEDTVRTVADKTEALMVLKAEVENFQKEVNSLTELFNSYYDLFKEVLEIKDYPLHFDLPEIKPEETDEKIGYVLGYDVRIIHETMLKLTAVQSKVAGIGNRLSKQYNEVK